MDKRIKIDRRAIKEDKFTTFVFLAKDYVLNNWTYFVGGIILIIAVIAAVTFVSSSGIKSEQAAIDLYNRAMGELSVRNYQPAVADLKAVIDQYGSSSQARMALFLLGSTYLEMKSYSEAETAFEKFLGKYGEDRYFTVSAISGIAAALAGTGDMPAAAAKYREAAEKYPDMELAGDYYLKAMHYYLKSGDMESARSMYAKIAERFAGTAYYTNSRRIASEYKLSL